MDNYQYDNQPDPGDTAMIEPEIILTCLDDRGEGTCRGPVEHNSLDGIKFWPRCDFHFDKRLQRYEESETEKYAHSDIAPPGFDSAEAGERWNEDDY